MTHCFEELCFIKDIESWAFIFCQLNKPPLTLKRNERIVYCNIIYIYKADVTLVMSQNLFKISTKCVYR